MRAMLSEDLVLDARGLQCPMPIVMANREIRLLEPGQIMKVLTTDRGSLADFPAWANDVGHEIIASGEADGALYFFLQKGYA